jgi:carboxymethylenebutenolidase
MSTIFPQQPHVPVTAVPVGSVGGAEEDEQAATAKRAISAGAARRSIRHVRIPRAYRLCSRAGGLEILLPRRSRLMGLTIESVRFGMDAEYAGYLAYPGRAATPLPAVVVIQEAWGVDDHIEEVTRRFAIAGYAALAPDIYALKGERPPALTRERTAEMKAFFERLNPAEAADTKHREAVLDTMPEPGRSRVRESMQTMFARVGGADVNLPPVVAAAKFLREGHAVTRGQKVGSVGFCMGGGLSAMLAVSDPELAGAVMFYGMAPREELIAAIRCPVLGLYGGLDARINAGLPAFVEAMKKHGKSFEHHVYEGAHHAFFNETRQTYDVRAARDAYSRVLAFFRERLG